MAVTRYRIHSPPGPRGAAAGPRGGAAEPGQAVSDPARGQHHRGHAHRRSIYFATQPPADFSPLDSFKTLLPYFAPFAILAAGEVFVMINGEIDLSIGAM